MTLKLLSGIRVLELAIEIPGNQAPSILADMGADVIKIEPPPVGDYVREVYPIETGGEGERHFGIGVAHLMWNRNKRSLTLDLKQPEAKEIFYRLLETTDVVFDLSIPGTRTKLGVDYESCRARKPDIVYVALSGFGATGPYATIPSHGFAPPAFLGQVTPVAQGDGTYRIETRGVGGGGVSGATVAALAMLAGLAYRDRNGEGVYLETSQVDPGVYANSLNFYDHYNPKHPHGMPAVGSARYTAYETGDGKFVMFMPLERKFWERFCAAIERPDWVARYGSEGTHMDYGEDDTTLGPELAELFKTKSQMEWVMLLGPAGVPCTPLGSFDDLLDDEAFMDGRELKATYYEPRLGDDVTLASFPLRRPGQRFEVERPAPDVGQHNEEVLAELGYSPEEIAALTAKRVVFTR